MNKIKLVTGITTLGMALTATPAFAWYDLSNEERCAFGQTFEGPGNTSVSVSQSKERFNENNSVLIIISNKNWSLAEGDNVGRIRLETDDGAWLENEGFAIENGFVLHVSYEHFDNVFGSVPLGMGVFRNNTQIDSLNMSMVTSAVAGFNRCRSPWILEKSELERKAEIERNYSGDPFAD